MTAPLLLRRLTVLAAVAVVGTMLAGCGPGNGGTSPAGSGHPAASTRPASPAGGQASGAGQGTTVAAAHVTGHFCTDFPRLMARVPRIPPGDKGNLAALRKDATRLLATAAGDFTALAGESPPQVATALRAVASVYQHNEGVALAQGSAASLEQLINRSRYTGSGLAALGVVAHYYASHCLGSG